MHLEVSRSANRTLRPNTEKRSGRRIYWERHREGSGFPFVGPLPATPLPRRAGTGIEPQEKAMAEVPSGAPQDDADARARIQPFGALIGDWTLEMTHPAFPDVIVKGQARFEWLNGERFLVQRAENDHPDFPDSLSVIGVMEGEHELSMQYFDSRGVHRIYRVVFDGKELELWRDDPGFAQRIVMKLSADGARFGGVWQLNQNGQGFRDDAAITYRRLTH
jgi:hypothetical protein